MEIREHQTPSSGIFFKTRKVFYSGHSPYQKIEVFENESFGRVLFLDGLVQTTEKDEFFYHEMLAHPALVSHPAPRKVLIIGGGDGGILREVLRHPVERAWLVEIDARVVGVAREFFPWLSPALEDRRSELVIADGNAFIRETEERFDVVLVDSSDPVGPSVSLHEKDFYENLKHRLSPGGVVAAQSGSPLHHLGELKAKQGFLKELFRIVRFYLGPVPTYPGGTWCYVFLSDGVDPLASPRREPPAGLKHYNPDIHRAAFALPEFMRRRLD